jgi:uncharacterized protein YjgD (DUF1641 family)
MAVPVAFEPKKLDPRIGLSKRLENAPEEHAEALLVLYDLLQSAHDQGLLDAAHGFVQAKDMVFGELASGAKKQETVAALRNLISLGKILGALDPEALSCAVAAIEKDSHAEEPPSLWQIFRSVRTRESRRALGILTTLLRGIGTRR